MRVLDSDGKLFAQVGNRRDPLKFRTDWRERMETHERRIPGGHFARQGAGHRAAISDAAAFPGPSKRRAEESAGALPYT